MLSERILGILPPDTALTWETIARIVPPTAYLAEARLLPSTSPTG